MKNLFFSVMLLAAAMVSCAEDEASMGDYTIPDNGDLLSINVYSGTTKGLDTETTTLQDSGSVLLHIDDNGTLEQRCEFSYSGSDWSQKADSKIIWSDIVFPSNFYSLHDGKNFKNLTFGNGYAELTSYSVTDASSSHKDLVYHASVLDAIPVGGAVSVNHKHALSKIELYASTGDNIVYIARAILYNVDGQGTVTITPLAIDADATEVGAKWTNGTSNLTDYEYYYIGTDAASAYSTTTDGTNPISDVKEAPLMIIPQTTTAITYDEVANGKLMEGSYIEVIYYMTNASNDPLVGYSSISKYPDANDYVEAEDDITLYVMGAFPLGYEFEVNKAYDINLGLGADCTTGGMLVYDYYVDKDGDAVKLTKIDDTTSEVVEIPDLEPGDDILKNLNAEIDITVTVSDWVDGSSTTIN